mgnify:CR=1 FL=1
MSYIYLSKQTDTVGIDRLRDEISGTPLAYRPTVTHTVQANASGSSNSVLVRVAVPCVLTVDGVTSATDTFLATSKFTSLQKITNDAERAKAYDDHIRYLIATRGSNLLGQLPNTPLPAKWSTFDVAAAAQSMA